MNLLWQWTIGEDRLRDVATRIIRDVGDDLFCLWLQGGLGAGKTTITGAILHELGLDERIPVTSPTYTYMNEYQVAGRWYAHLDLYRAAAAFSLEDLGLLDTRPFHGILVEWPEQVPEDPAIEPSHVLKIAFAGNERSYELFSRE